MSPSKIRKESIIPYIHFTDEQKRQANSADLVEFLRSKGEPLIRSGSEFRMSSNTVIYEGTVYSSDTSAEDCYLCGGGIENLIPDYWGQNNIALLSLNTFEIKPLEINRYNKTDGRLVEKYVGAVSISRYGSDEGGFAASLLLDYDKGYAVGSVDFYNDGTLDICRVSGFLCEDCLNNLLPSLIDQYFGAGAINLATKEVRVFEKHLSGFGLGDFYIDCDLQEQDGNNHRMDLLIFYCPIRYK